MQVIYKTVVVRKGASRRKKKLRRTLRLVLRALSVSGILALLLVLVYLAAQAAYLLIDGGAPGELFRAITAPATNTAPAQTDGGLPNETGAPVGMGMQAEVTPILQMPELRNGCEATSLAMVLQSAGYPAEKTELAYAYIPREDFTEQDGTFYGPYPGDAYAGDPAESRGFYCYTPALAEGGNNYLAAQGSGIACQDITGTNLTAMEGYLDSGTPVVIWATIDYEDHFRYVESFSWLLPDGRTYVPYLNLHCVVLCGYNDGSYTVCDPLEGLIQVGRGQLQASYDLVGQRALVVV